MRGFLITIVLGVAAFGGVAWYMGLLPFPEKPTSQAPASDNSDDRPSKAPTDLGPDLYKAAAPVVPAVNPVGLGQYKDPIVLQGHNVVLEKQDVSSKRPGQILFIGEEIPDGAPAPDGPVFTAKVYQGGGKEVKEVLKRYRRLEEGDRVKEDQMVAMLDYSLALNDWMSKKTKIDATIAEYKSAIATKLEAQSRLERWDRMRIDSAKFVPAEEYSGAVLTRDRYMHEEQTKKVAITVAEIDAEQGQLVYKEHEIRNKIPGISIIKTIYKNRGDYVKEQDLQIMHLYNISRLRAEGLVEVQYLEQLRVGMKVSLEPVEENAPLRVLNEHRDEVTSVAVSPDGKDPLIVSGSKDGTARVWSRTQSRALCVLPHPTAVRMLACSPKGGKQRWLLTGCTDGSLRLWDLNKDSTQPVWDSSKGEQTNPHRDAITALAFSPDGSWFATGGEDNTMALWQTDGGKLLYTFDAEHGVDSPHQDPITALYFTPQCQLVSASRDNTLRVWELHQKGARQVGEAITGRGGSVANIGVSADGQWALVDKGKMLQVLSLADRRTHSVVQNVSGATPFETLALFSPDARLILTAGMSEGRLQLWRAPTDGKRGFELRQYATAERSPVTCAAFAPDAGTAADGSFAVSGTKDGHVYIWSVPNRDKVDRYRMENLRLTLIDHNVEANTRQARIGVNVQNPINDEYPSGRLIPGRPVHIVIEPE